MVWMLDDAEQERRDALREEGEPLEGGITNEVYDLGDSIGKIYPRFSWNLALPSIYRARYGDLDLLTRDDRIQNEQDALEYMQEAGFDTPELEESGDTYAVWEKIEGENELGELDTDEIYDSTKEVGENLADLHEDDIAIADNRYENFFYTGDTITSIDHEMVRTDAPEHDKDLDVLTWLSSIKRLDEEAYSAARDGFFDGYGGEVKHRSDLLTTGMAIGHTLYELDTDGLTNVVTNSLPG